MKPKKLTIVGGKRVLVDHDSRAEEYRDYNKQRWKYDKKVQQFYNSSLWRKTSKSVLLEEDYVCRMCEGEATMTDHIIPVRERWDLRLDRTNLQASCKACNDTKAIRDRKRYSN